MVWEQNLTPLTKVVVLPQSDTIRRIAMPDVRVVKPDLNRGWLVYVEEVPNGYTAETLRELHKELFNGSLPIEQDRFLESTGNWLMIELGSGITPEQLGTFVMRATGHLPKATR